MDQKRARIGVGPINSAMAAAVTTMAKGAGISSVEKLAEAAGIPAGTLRPRMQGKRAFDVEQVFALGQAVGYTAAHLMSLAENIYAHRLQKEAHAAGDFSAETAALIARHMSGPPGPA